ncbi:hypothetical protein ACJQWK_06664 [Exserohilum turcicum]|uniref:Glycoside hydrolase family 128 protein n=1 Tax=Exserohilum turcicum (strain 28A) TaxID=671987 RepID=R0K9I1_EXST2|nr:glycoside hydrolase family 128 protein [Exserohilum turcica Et28A]EOA84932.1 glycoside hydrolase family 128 protein [Exserohilum turcica Et28A]
MSSSIKITSLLALASSVAAVPHFQHQKFHHRAAAYPTGGWGGAHNASMIATPSGTAVYPDDKTTTIRTTSTTTSTVYETIHAKPSAKPSLGAGQANVDNVSSSSVCGGVVTVTEKQKVTVTITPGAPGGGAAAPPTSSPAAAASKPAGGNGYPVASPPAPKETPAKSSPAGYPANIPVKTPVVQYPAETPKPAPSQPAPSQPAAEKPVPSAPAPSKPAETPVYSPSETPKASSTAPSSSAAPKPTPGNSYSGAKRGLAYNDAALCSTLGSNFGFGYNWGQVENNDIGTMFVPMMHKPSDSTPEDWLANVDKAVKKGTTAVMGFNECDIASQCNLSPEAACTAWKSYMNPIKSAHPDVTIIGPSVSNGQAPLGLDWLSRFHSSCPDAIVDAVNIHFYDIYDDKTIDRFTAHVEKAAEVYGMKVFVTEFGLNSGTATQDQAASFLKQCMDYLDASDKVSGYSWFMVGTGENQLNVGTGLSPVGKVYAGQA